MPFKSMKLINSLFLYAIALTMISLSADRASAQGLPITFSVLGDVPYGPEEVPIFQGYIDDHNRYSKSEFFIHVGDIMAEGEPCVEDHYTQTASILKGLEVPAYIILGDNEWNDCSDPDQALSYWKEHLLHLEQNFCGLPKIYYQDVRPDNFAFVKKGVLFIGISMPSGGGANASQRLKDNAEWIEYFFQNYVDSVRTAVVFGHSDVGRAFISRFETAAVNFVKPVIYIMGNGHNWKWDYPFNAANIRRLQVDNGGAAPPVEMTVSMDPQNPFIYERDPWPPGSPEVIRTECGSVMPIITIEDVEAEEGDTDAKEMLFDVKLLFPNGADVSVDFATIDNSATAGDDYLAASGTLNFPKGSTLETISILINGDKIYEEAEVFELKLEGATNAVIIDPIAIGTILDDDLPEQFALNQNYPNPFNKPTSISFDLPEPGHVRLEIYDINGRLVSILINDSLPEGTHTLEWKALNQQSYPLSSGFYFCRLSFGGTVITRKMILTR